MSEDISISFRIVEIAGETWAYDHNGYFRPPKNSSIMAKYQIYHTTPLTAGRCYLTPANKAETLAFIHGGKNETLESFCEYVLGERLPDFYRKHAQKLDPVETWLTKRSKYFSNLYHSIEAWLNFRVYCGEYKNEKRNMIYFQFKKNKSYMGYFIDAKDGDKSRAGSSQSNKAPSQSNEPFIYFSHTAKKEDKWYICDSPKDILALQIGGCQKIAASYAGFNITHEQLGFLIDKGGSNFVLVVDSKNDDRKKAGALGRKLKKENCPSQFIDFNCDAQDGMDATDFLNQFGPEKLKEALLEVNDELFYFTKMPDDLTELPSAKPFGDSDGFDLTEDGNAKRFVKLFGKKFKWIDEWKIWIFWNDIYWQRDVHGHEAKKAAQKIIDYLKDLKTKLKDKGEITKLEKFIEKSSNHHHYMQILNLCKSHLFIAFSELDTRTHLLGVKNGTLNLQTGRLTESDPEYLITRVANVLYDPEAQCPNFEKLVAWQHKGNIEIVEYIQRAFGYSLTGEISEQAIFIWHGSGFNAKSVIMGTLVEMLGEYAGVGDANTYIQSKNERTKFSVAEIDGLRLVSVGEIPDNHTFDMSLLKRITDLYPMQIERKHERPYSILPRCKLFFHLNHLPRILDGTKGTWRRLHLINFEQSIVADEKDGKLPYKLQKEHSGILNWCLKGCIDWYATGNLRIPAIILANREEWHTDSDAVQLFIEEQCELGDDFFYPANLFFKNYEIWAKNNDHHDITRQSHLDKKMMERGFKRERKDFNAPNDKRLQLRAFIGIKYIGENYYEGSQCVTEYFHYVNNHKLKYFVTGDENNSDNYYEEDLPMN